MLKASKIEPIQKHSIFRAMKLLIELTTRVRNVIYEYPYIL